MDFQVEEGCVSPLANLLEYQARPGATFTATIDNLDKLQIPHPKLIPTRFQTSQVHFEGVVGTTHIRYVTVKVIEYDTIRVGLVWVTIAIKSMNERTRCSAEGGRSGEMQWDSKFEYEA